MNEPIDFKARLAAKRAELEGQGKLKLAAPDLPRAPSIPKPTQAFDDDLIPDTGTPVYEFEADIDRLISSIGIIDAYKKWIPGQEIETNSKKTEGIKCQCPLPAHADKNPSAWVNTDNNRWFCGGCQIGGDGYDLAAIYYGMPDYKNGSDKRKFHELRRKIMSEYGYVFRQDAHGDWEMLRPGQEEPEPEPEPELPPAAKAPEPEPEPSTEPDNVWNIDGSVEPPPPGELPSLDWRSIAQPHTFLAEFTSACSADDVPEEYHFWNAMLAIGLVLGRDISLMDRKVVYGNLFVCMLGRSGAGKSRSKAYLDEVIHTVLPFEEGNPATKGARLAQAPASAEALIHSFVHELEDPSAKDPTKAPKLRVGGVKTLVDYNEFSSLASRTKRTGNALSPTLMQFYDGDSEVSTRSMTHGLNMAKDPFGSVITTSQPAVIGRLLEQEDIDSGFVNRWLFAIGTEKKRVALGGAQINLERAIDPLQNIKGWAAVPRVIEWTPEASDKFTHFFDTEIEPMKQKDTDSVITRIDLTMKKLILLFTANAMEDKVTPACVDMAIKCYPYMMSCYGLLSDKIAMTESNEIADEIMRLVEYYEKKHKGAGATSREVTGALARRKWDKTHILKMFETLEKLGMIHIVPNKTGKPSRTVRYGVTA